MIHSVCVITSYCGESQYNECVNSVKEQKDVYIEHIIIKDKNFIDSQVETFNIAKNTKCKFVCKLDSDMVLPDQYYLKDLISKFEDNLERLYVLVDDYYSKRKIIGMHVIRKSAIKDCYIKNINLPQPDLWINEIKSYKKVNVNGRYVRHGFNPTDQQLYRYGYSRGKKIFSQRRGVNSFITFVSIIKSGNYKILKGYADGMGCNKIEDIDTLNKLFSYLNFNLLKRLLLLMKIKLIIWFI
jgi:hypothetical protein